MISETANAAKPLNAGIFKIWAGHLQMQPHGKGSAIVQIRAAGRDDISDALLEIVDGVIAETKRWKNEDLKAYCHKALKEYKEPPAGGRVAIDAEHILMAEGRTEAQIAKLQVESEFWNNFEAALA